MNSVVASVVAVALLLAVVIAVRADASEADALGLLGEPPTLTASPVERLFLPEGEVRALALEATVQVAGRNCSGVMIGSGVLVDDTLLSVNHVVVDAFDAKVALPAGPSFTPVVRRSVALDLVQLAPTAGRSLTWATVEARPGDLVTLAGHRGNTPTELIETTVLMVTDGEAYGIEGDILLLEGVVPQGFSGGPVLSVNGELLGIVRGYEATLDLTVALTGASIQRWLDSTTDSPAPQPSC